MEERMKIEEIIPLKVFSSYFSDIRNKLLTFKKKKASPEKHQKKYPWEILVPTTSPKKSII